MDSDRIQKFLNDHKFDRYQNIFLPKFHTDYPITLNRICIQHIEAPPADFKSNFHAHSYYELHILLSGCASYLFDPDGSVRLIPGYWLLIPCHVTHKILQYTANTLLVTFQFCIAGEDTAYVHLFKDILHRTSVLTEQITEEQLQALFEIFEASTAPLSLLTTQNTALNLVINLMKSIERHILPSDDNQNIRNRDARYQMALEYIGDNICRKIGAEDVASNVYLSVRHLNRIFQKKIGKTVSEYILLKKADRSKEVLQISDLPLHDIATELGFRDEYYFSRFFKKAWGISPHQYRLWYRRQYGNQIQEPPQSNR